MQRAGFRELIFIAADDNDCHPCSRSKGLSF